MLAARQAFKARAAARGVRSPASARAASARAGSPASARAANARAARAASAAPKQGDWTTVPASSYAKNRATFQSHYARDCFEGLAARPNAAAVVSNATAILDVGSGTGDFARDLVDRYPDAVVTGVDLAEAMVAHANDTHPHPRLSFVAADLAGAHGLGETFDVATSTMVFWPRGTLRGGGSRHRRGCRVDIPRGGRAPSRREPVRDRPRGSHGVARTLRRQPSADDPRRGRGAAATHPDGTSSVARGTLSSDAGPALAGAGPGVRRRRIRSAEARRRVSGRSARRGLVPGGRRRGSASGEGGPGAGFDFGRPADDVPARPARGLGRRAGTSGVRRRRRPAADFRDGVRGPSGVCTSFERTTLRESWKTSL